MQGRKKAPNNLRILRGETHQDRYNDNEPTAPNTSPDMPRGMSAQEKRFWKEAVQDLTTLGILASTDRNLLRLYAESLADYTDARKSRGNDHAHSVTTKAGEIETKRNYFAVAVNEYRAMVHKLGSELGLSPTSRTRLSVAPKEEAGIQARKRG